jgi:hypothetical protein
MGQSLTGVRGTTVRPRHALAPRGIDQADLGGGAFHP